MPFLLIEGIGDLIWAIVAIAGGTSIAVVLRGLINRLPNIGIPFTSFNVHSILDSALVHLEVDLFNATRFGWGRLTNWLRGHAYVLAGFTGVVIKVTSHLGDQVAHLNNVSIPEGDRSTGAAAAAALSTVSTNLQHNIDSARSEASSATSGLRGYVDGAFEKTIDKAIADAQTGAELKAHAELATAESNLVAQINDVQGQVTGLESLVQYTVPAEIASAVASQAVKDRAALVSATQSLQGEIVAQQSSINQLGGLITSDETRIATAEANIARLSSAAVVDEAQIATQREAISVAQTNIVRNASAIDTATGNIDRLTNQLDTVTASQRIDEANTGVLQEITSIAIPAAIAAVASGVASITTEFERCAVTTCDGPNEIGHILKGLLATFTAASEIGFIAEAVRDPLGTAAAISPLLETIDAGASDALSLLLSL